MTTLFSGKWEPTRMCRFLFSFGEINYFITQRMNLILLLVKRENYARGHLTFKFNIEFKKIKLMSLYIFLTGTNRSCRVSIESFRSNIDLKLIMIFDSMAHAFIDSISTRLNNLSLACFPRDIINRSSQSQSKSVRRNKMWS